MMVSLAHLVGMGLVLYLVKKRNLPINPYLDLMFAVVLSGVVGARSTYVIEHWQEFTSPLEWFQLWRGGLSVFGGLLFGFPAYLAFLCWRKLPIWETSDFLVPIFPLSLAIVRVGCFSAGCCHGAPTSLPWGIVPKSELTPLYLAGEPLHPTQLYECFFLLGLSVFLFCLNRKRLKTGIVVSAFLVGYSLYRVLTNPFRGDLEISATLGTSQSQAGAAILLSLSLVTLIWRLLRAEHNGQAE